jgi:hypothetical protein
MIPNSETGLYMQTTDNRKQMCDVVAKYDHSSYAGEDNMLRLQNQE